MNSRVSRRMKIGALLVVSASAVLTATQGGGSQFPKQISVPTVTVPSIDLRTVRQPQPSQKLMPTLPPDELAAYTMAAERKLAYMPGQVLVKFRSNVGRAGQQRALANVGSQPNITGATWIGDVALIKDPVELDSEVLAQQLRAQPEVLYAEPNYLQHTMSDPNDPSYALRQTNFSTIGMSRAWDISAGGSSSLIVAVVDTGVTTVPVQTLPVSTWNGSAIVPYAAPIGMSTDFDASRFVSPRDFTISASNPPAIAIDTDGHGTHTASTIGENSNNNFSLAGIAYNVKIMPLKACQSYWDVQFARSAAGTPGFAPANSGGCPTAATSAAVRFAADNGAKIINYSIGGNSVSQTMQDAMNYAVSKGVFVAISNGNDFEDGNLPSYPAAYASAINGAMAVAATNSQERRSYYSTTGSYTEIAAPGGDSRVGILIFQTTLRVSDSNEAAGVIFPRFDRYDEVGYQGTSMAAPHVAGIAALIMSRGVTDPAQIESILRQSAKDIGTAGRDNEFGFGLVQPFRALFGQGIRR